MLNPLTNVTINHCFPQKELNFTPTLINNLATPTSYAHWMSIVNRISKTCILLAIVI